MILLVQDIFARIFCMIQNHWYIEFFYKKKHNLHNTKKESYIIYYFIHSLFCIIFKIISIHTSTNYYIKKMINNKIKTINNKNFIFYFFLLGFLIISCHICICMMFVFIFLFGTRYYIMIIIVQKMIKKFK